MYIVVGGRALQLLPGRERHLFYRNVGREEGGPILALLTTSLQNEALNAKSGVQRVWARGLYIIS